MDLVRLRSIVCALKFVRCVENWLFGGVKSSSEAAEEPVVIGCSHGRK